MNDTVNLLFLHQLIESIEVADVHLYKLIVGLVLHIFKIGEIACIGKLVQIDDVIFGIFVYEKAYYMASYKACTAGDNDISHIFCFEL